jgi:Leucine-rich repeat (LRR) protein
MRLSLLVFCVLSLSACTDRVNQAEKPVVVEAPNQAVLETELAIDGVKRLGGTIERDDKADGKPVIGVNLARAQAADAGLKKLAVFKQLRVLNLGHTPITNAGLKDLVGLPNLQKLYLDGTQVTDAGLKTLAALPQLEWLYLSETKLTDACLKDLSAMKQLRMLYLDDTDVTANGVAELKMALPDCEVIK